ncbi:MAG: hypothetical protein ACFFCS_15190 [Candidatus Hodarchaeota archaeon]
MASCESTAASTTSGAVYRSRSSLHAASTIPLSPGVQGNRNAENFHDCQAIKREIHPLVFVPLGG